MPALAGLLESGSAHLWHLEKLQAQKGIFTTHSVPSPRLVPPYPRDEEAIWALDFPHTGEGAGWSRDLEGSKQSMAQHPQQGEQPCPAQAAQGALQGSERDVPGSGSFRVACLMHFMSPQRGDLGVLVALGAKGDFFLPFLCCRQAYQLH